MTKRSIEFESSLSYIWSSTLFDDCEVSFDPEFGFVVVESRGYEVIIELGNTADWKTGCAMGGFDDALRIIIKDSRELDEEKAIKDFFVPVREDEALVKDHD